MRTTKIPELVEVLPDRVRFHPHKGQQAAWRSTARFLLVLAGTQGGKTSFSPPWLHREIDRYPPCHVEGEADYLAASATYDLLSLKLLPAMRRYFCELTKWGTYMASQRLIRSKTDASRIIFRSADAPGSMESATGRAAVLDEFGLQSVPLMAWEAIQRRLSINQGRALFTTTPYELGWLYQQVYMRAKGGDSDYGVVSFRSVDNPAFPEEEFERARRTLPDWKFRMMYLGEFTRPAGLIYGDYTDAYAPQRADGTVDLGAWVNGVHGHLCRPFPIPPTWLRTVGVDFGGTEHTGLVWFAREPGAGNYYTYREALGGGLSGQEHARAAREYGEPVQQALGGSGSEDEARREWARAGFPVSEPRIGDVEPGIDHVIALLKQRQLFVFETLTNLRSEFGTYSRELDASGEPLMRISRKERFHLLDGTRYAASAFSLNRPPAPESDIDPRLASRRRSDLRALREEEEREARRGSRNAYR